MSNDLITYVIGQLRGACWEEEAAAVEALVDRIEQLEESNKELTLQLLAAHGQAADALDKLTETVEALRDTTQMLSQCTFTIIRMKGQYFERHEVVDKANAVLAKLRGTK
jgi:outer membrane murein-binding lipoprotein Lpp